MYFLMLSFLSFMINCAEKVTARLTCVQDMRICEKVTKLHKGGVRPKQQEQLFCP